MKALRTTLALLGFSALTVALSYLGFQWVAGSAQEIDVAFFAALCVLLVAPTLAFCVTLPFVPRDLQDRGRSALFMLYFVALVGGQFVVWWGNIAQMFIGILFAPFVGMIIRQVYLKMTGSARRGRGDGRVVAGSTACPSCDSLQTDKVTAYQADDSKRPRWQCFQCDHVWQVIKGRAAEAL